MRKIGIVLFVAIIALAGCAKKKEAVAEKTTVITQGLKFCEGSVPYGSSLLVSNFGCETLSPLNSDGKGYVSIIEGKEAKPFIVNDGVLSAPKGMAVADDYLYIADVSKVVVYNLKDKTAAPQIVLFPGANLFVNDIVIKDKVAYVSVTNTGKLFTLDVSDPATLSADKLTEYADVVGANGLALDGDKLYIASYPADGQTTADNVIYLIQDIHSPVVEKLITRQGQYDGLALEGDKLYFTSWVDGEVGYVDLKTKAVELLAIDGVQLAGPADISILNDSLYIPCLPQSQLVVVSLK